MKEPDIKKRKAWPEGTWFQRRLRAVRAQQLDAHRRHESTRNQMPESTKPDKEPEER